MVQRNLLNDQS